MIINLKLYDLLSSRNLILVLLIFLSFSCIKNNKTSRLKEIEPKQVLEEPKPSLSIIYLEEKKQLNMFRRSLLKRTDPGKYGNDQLGPIPIRGIEDGDGVRIEIPKSDYVIVNSKNADEVAKAKPIFEEEPSIEHIKQTSCFTGLPSLNCPFLSALSTTLKLDASIIKNLIYDDVASGKVYVRLWDWKNQKYIDYEMLKQRDLVGTTIPPRYKYTQNGKLWTHLFERAMDRHLTDLGETGFPIKEKDRAINSLLALKSILGEEYRIEYIPESKVPPTKDLLGLVLGGTISNIEFETNLLPPLKQNHSYGIVGVQREPEPGFLLYDSLDPSTGKNPVFLSFETFKEFPNGRLIMQGPASTNVK